MTHTQGVRRLGLFIFCSSLLGAPRLSANPRSFESLDAVEFLGQAEKSWMSLKTPEAATILNKGQVAYLPLSELIRGQDEISIDNIKEKIRTRLKAKDLDWKPKKKAWALAHDSGRSAVGSGDPIDVIRGPKGYVVLDGHHDLYLSLFVGAQNVAVRVKEDLSSLGPEEFWQKLHNENWIYLKETPQSLAKTPPVMMRVKDNPNRYLAALLAYKVGTETQDRVLELSQAKGSKVPVWIKVNEGVPFVEFYIAKILSDAGIFYDAAWGKDVPEAVVEKSRRALLDARASGRFKFFEEVAVPKNAAEAALVVRDFMELQKLLQRDCSDFFKSLMGP